MYFKKVRENWMHYWAEPAQRLEMLASFAALNAVMFTMLWYLPHNELRVGVQLSDPLLPLIPAVDLSNLTFFLLYLGLVVTVLLLLPHPTRLTLGFQIYALYAIFRMTSMWLVPLEPPAGIIPLVDPLMSWAQTGKQLNKDLFFSGHTATMYIFYLVLPHGRTRSIYFLGFLVMAAALIVQRVHYSVDVLSAPFFCYGALGLVQQMRRRLGLKDIVL